MPRSSERDATAHVPNTQCSQWDGGADAVKAGTSEARPEHSALAHPDRPTPSLRSCGYSAFWSNTPHESEIIASPRRTACTWTSTRRAPRAWACSTRSWSGSTVQPVPPIVKHSERYGL